jgi:hypothetical protein
MALSTTTPARAGQPASTPSLAYRSWQDTGKPASPKKPEAPVEDERELARRALQTSMDTRQ